MALESLTILTKLAVLLIIGLFGTAASKKLRISNVLMLLLIGLVIGKTTSYFEFESVFLVALATITLALVVFEGTSKLSYRQLDKLSLPALNLTAWYFVFTAAAVGAASYALFFANYSSAIFLSLILAVALAGTDPSAVLLILQEHKQKLVQLLTLEAVVNTPIVLIVPFIILDMITQSASLAQLGDLLQQLVVGIGAGVILGLLIFKSLRKFYSDEISTVAVIAAALLSYILAENLQGSGVLAVATLGIMFGNVKIKKKERLQDFSFAFSNILELLIFPLIGIIIGGELPLTLGFALKSLAIFAVLVAARALAMILVFHDEYSWKEMLFLTMSMPKGIAVAVLIFTFLLFPEVPEVLLSVVFTVSIYSIIAATVTGYWWNTATDHGE